MNNDIVTKARLNAALGTEGNMGFEHNDIVTVDRMNEAIAEGGGGGDFSTAQVTFINSESGKHYNVRPVWPKITEDGLKCPDGEESIIVTSQTFMIPMYKGRAIVPSDCIYNVDSEVTPTFTGGVELDESFNFVITGDGTITAKGNFSFG